VSLESVNEDFTVGIVHLRRLVFALILGSAVALLPMVTYNFPESGIYGATGLAIRFLLLPGVLVCMLAVRNIHAIDLHAIHVVNITFYVALFYFLFGAWAKRKAKSKSSDGR